MAGFDFIKIEFVSIHPHTWLQLTLLTCRGLGDIPIDKRHVDVVTAFKKCGIDGVDIVWNTISITIAPELTNIEHTYKPNPSITYVWIREQDFHVALNIKVSVNITSAPPRIVLTSTELVEKRFLAVGIAHSSRSRVRMSSRKSRLEGYRGGGCHFEIKRYGSGLPSSCSNSHPICYLSLNWARYDLLSFHYPNI